MRSYFIVSICFIVVQLFCTNKTVGQEQYKYSDYIPPYIETLAIGKNFQLQDKTFFLRNGIYGKWRLDFTNNSLVNDSTLDVPFNSADYFLTLYNREGNRIMDLRRLQGRTLWEMEERDWCDGIMYEIDIHWLPNLLLGRRSRTDADRNILRQLPTNL